MSVKHLKCENCDEVTTDTCPTCHEVPWCAECAGEVGSCVKCEPEPDLDALDDDEDFGEDEDEDDYSDLDDEFEDDEADDPKSWPAPERDE